MKEESIRLLIQSWSNP